MNCPITIDDARRAEQIYGKDIAFLKGKTTALAATTHVPDFMPVALPPELLSLHPNITLCFDLFYVLGLGFSLSTSRNIRFLSCHYIADRTKPILQTCIAADLKLYKTRGFNPQSIHADGEFTALQPAFPNIHFTICSADDHVPEIERAIRTVKESIRTAIHGMPYSRLPRVLVKELTNHAIRTLNMLPHPDGVSSSLSPAAIVTGAPKTDYRTLALEFGTYVQVYDGTSNDTKSRTLGAIATNPTGNSSGDYYFMSLATGHRIHRRSWTVLPISDAVISRVEAIAFEENMPPIDTGHPLPEYDPDAIVDISEYDRTYVPPAVPDSTSDHELTSDAYTDGSDDSDDDPDDDIGHHPDFDDDVPIEPITVPTTMPAIVHEERNDITDTAINNPTTEQHTETEERHKNEERSETTQNEERKINEATQNEERKTISNEERETILNEERETPRPSGLRPKHSPNYSYRYDFTQITAKPATSITKAWRAIESMENTTRDPETFTPTEMQSIHKAIVGLMFTQMSAKKGIQKHGELALNALRKEFEQFKALDVLEPLDAFTLTDDQKAEALRALSVIKEKRDGTIKGRTCADGSTQQGKFS